MQAKQVMDMLARRGADAVSDVHLAVGRNILVASIRVLIGDERTDSLVPQCKWNMANPDHWTAYMAWQDAAHGVAEQVKRVDPKLWKRVSVRLSYIQLIDRQVDRRRAFRIEENANDQQN